MLFAFFTYQNFLNINIIYENAIKPTKNFKIIFLQKHNLWYSIRKHGKT